LTIPAAGAVAALMEAISRIPGGEGIVFVLGVVMAIGAFVAAAGWLAGRGRPPVSTAVPAR
jgi:hypothetical protein